MTATVYGYDRDMKAYGLVYEGVWLAHAITDDLIEDATDMFWDGVEFVD